jgi:hypothetical protein
MFPSEHSVPAQFQHGNSKARLEADFAVGRRAFFALIEEPLGQEKQAVLVPGSAQAGSRWPRTSFGKRQCHRACSASRPQFELRDQ